MITHTPVLLAESVDAIPVSARRIIDGTLGLGGHAATFLRKAPQAALLGLDQDEVMLQRAQEQLTPYKDRVNLIRANFKELTAAAGDIEWDWTDVVFLDLGISSAQLSDPSRGLSFQHNGPLDMRLDTGETLTAAGIVNSWEETQLVQLFRTLGEEPQARSIARAIVRERSKNPFKTTSQLVQTIEQAVPARIRFARKTHIATNVFRALRMAVNDELGALQTVLPQALDLVRPGGIIIVISFQSLEDRIVKRFFRAQQQLTVMTKKPIQPSEREIEENPRSRSAKLRIAKKNDKPPSNKYV